jgi:hypothetical protein
MMTNKIASKNIYLGISMVLLAGIIVVGGIGNAFSQNTTDAPSTIPPSGNSTGSGNLNITEGGNTGNWTNSNATTTVQ